MNECTKKSRAESADSKNLDLFDIGNKLEAQDEDGTWYPARIEDVNKVKKQILVHFDRWNAKFDQWIKMDSKKIRHLQRPPPKIQRSFEIGEEVVAAWSFYKCRGKINKILAIDKYEVLFETGELKSVSNKKIWPLNAAEASGVGTNVSHGIVKPETEEIGSKQDRRDRKRKIIVKDLFYRKRKLSDSSDKSKRPSRDRQSLPGPDTAASPKESPSPVPAKRRKFERKPTPHVYDNSDELTQPVDVVHPDGTKETWSRILVTRKEGLSCGKVSVVIVSTTGRKFRSTSQFTSYCQDNNIKYNPTQVNYTVKEYPRKKQKVVQSAQPSIDVAKDDVTAKRKSAGRKRILSKDELPKVTPSKSRRSSDAEQSNLAGRKSKQPLGAKLIAKRKKEGVEDVDVEKVKSPEAAPEIAKQKAIKSHESDESSKSNADSVSTEVETFKAPEVVKPVESCVLKQKASGHDIDESSNSNVDSESTEPSVDLEDVSTDSKYSADTTDSKSEIFAIEIECDKTDASDSTESNSNEPIVPPQSSFNTKTSESNKSHFNGPESVLKLAASSAEETSESSNESRNLVIDSNSDSKDSNTKSHVPEEDDLEAPNRSSSEEPLSHLLVATKSSSKADNHDTTSFEDTPLSSLLLALNSSSKVEGAGTTVPTSFEDTPLSDLLKAHSSFSKEENLDTTVTTSDNDTPNVRNPMEEFPAEKENQVGNIDLPLPTQTSITPVYSAAILKEHGELSVESNFLLAIPSENIDSDETKETIAEVKSDKQMHKTFENAKPTIEKETKDSVEGQAVKKVNISVDLDDTAQSKTQVSLNEGKNLKTSRGHKVTPQIPVAKATTDIKTPGRPKRLSSDFKPSTRKSYPSTSKEANEPAKFKTSLPPFTVKTSRFYAHVPILPEVDPNVPAIVTVAGIEVEMINGLLVCPVKTCRKHFRKDNLLQMHMKHYHPDLSELLDSTPSVTDLAYARHAGGVPSSPAPYVRPPRTDVRIAESKRTPTRIGSKESKLETREAARLSDGATVHSPPGSIPNSKSPIVTLNEEKAIVNIEKIKHSVLESEQVTPAINIVEQTAPKVAMTAPDAPKDETDPVEPEVKNTAPTAPHVVDIKEESAASMAEDSSIVAPPAPVMTKRLVIKAERLKPQNLKERSEFEDVEDSIPAAILKRHASKSAEQLEEDSQGHLVQKNPILNTLLNTVPSAPPQPVTTWPKRRGRPPYKVKAAAKEEFEARPSTSIECEARLEEDDGYEKLEKLKGYEIINCICGLKEEDGLMIQCDVCQCWQHGHCQDIGPEEGVPDSYMCSVCKDPPKGRASQKYLNHQEWMKQGVLPKLTFSSRPRDTAAESLLKEAFDASAQLNQLSVLLHSLTIKLSYASAKSHPKLWFWANKWRNGREETEVKEETLVSSTPKAPEPEKPIDPAECKRNLLQHISEMYDLVQERLNTLETIVTNLEKRQDDAEEAAVESKEKTSATINMLIRDLDSVMRIAKLSH